MIKETPIAGKNYKVKLTNGTTWFFKSAYQGEHLTEFEAAYCINACGNDYFIDRIERGIGCHVGNNSDIISLVPANENEIAIFYRKLSL